MINSKIFIAGVLTLLLLSACSTLVPPQPAKTNQHYLSWTERQQQLRALTDWNMRGSLSVTYNHKTNIASFAWQKNQDTYLINVFGPMNLANAKIIGAPNKVILQQSSGKQAEATSAEELMLHQLGWTLPVNYLNYWIRGLPVPKIKAKSQFDNYNHIQNIRQQDWQITYGEYSSFYGIDLPTKIYITSPQLRAKIVIKQWQTSKPA